MTIDPVTSQNHEAVPVTRVRGVKPRKTGLLSEIHWQRDLPQNQTFSYALGDRILPDLTVIGHLCAGRWSEIYQVWSAEGWCSLTCKVLATRAVGNRTARAALRREHRILRKLHHPNVVRVFGGGENKERSYLLLEYLEGPSLLDILDALPGRRMAVPDAVRTVIHAGSGIAHMHRSGYLHLDLKPANLLLRDGVPVLLDMDTARPLHPIRVPRNSPGTVPYMSPEQALRQPLDLTADVYGLGTILYELLTGRWPFEDVYDGKDPRKGLEKQFPQTGRPPPPPPRRFRGEITPYLDKVIMKALSRNPRDRFQTIPAFLLALAKELKDPVSLWPKRTHPAQGRS